MTDKEKQKLLDYTAEEDIEIVKIKTRKKEMILKMLKECRVPNEVIYVVEKLWTKEEMIK